MNANRQAAVNLASLRKSAIAVGVLFLISDVASVPGRILYGPVLNDARFIAGPGPDTPVQVGALLEVIVALAIVGTAVALYPVAKRQNEGIALGYVGLRTLEAAIIAVGVVPMLAVVTLRQHFTAVAGADSAAFLALGTGLVAFNNWTAVIGPGLVCGVNTVLAAYLLYRSRLVPRFIPVLGLVGGPLVFAYNAAVVFGISGRLATWAVILVLPIFAWEVSLGVRLVVKGFNVSVAASELAKLDTSDALGAA